MIEIKKDYFSWGILETDDMIIGSILDYKVENQTVTFYVFVPSDEFRGTTETIMTWNMEYRLNDNSLQLKDQENWLTLAEETSFVDTPIYSSFLETHMKFRSFLNENAPRIKQIERDFPTYSSYEEAHAIFRENIADHHDEAIANGEESDITEYMKDESSGIHFRPNGRPFYMFRYVVGQNEVITYLVYADNKEVLKLQGKVYPTLTDSDESE